MNFPYPRFKAFDSNTGQMLIGGRLYFFLAGTVTPATVYQDQALTIAHSHPIQLDGAGEAEVWLDPAVAYKAVLHDAADVFLWSVDNIQVAEPAVLSILTVNGLSTLAAVTASGQITSTVAIGTAPFVVTSTTKVANLNADLLDGKQWDAPDPIGTTTPAAGKFTTLEATSTLDVAGATEIQGALQVNNDIGQQSANEALWLKGQVSEEITLNIAATFTESAANLLPANSIIEGVVARVTATIATATDWKLGDAAQTARFLAATTDLTLGTTKVGLAHRHPDVVAALGPVQATAAKLRITTTGVPSAGKVRVTVFYSQFISPAS